jgi:hypothetical protein
VLAVASSFVVADVAGTPPLGEWVPDDHDEQPTP